MKIETHTSSLGLCAERNANRLRIRAGEKFTSLLTD